MSRRTGYLAVAILLTILGAAMTVYCGMTIWEGCSGDIWAHGLLAFFAALEATSLANVWVQAILGSGVSLGSRTIECGWSVMPVPAEARGHSDV